MIRDYRLLVQAGEEGLLCPTDFARATYIDHVRNPKLAFIIQSPPEELRVSHK